MFFAGPCGEGWQFKQLVRAGRITGLLDGAAVRGVVHSSVLLGVYIVKRVWFLVLLPRLLRYGNIFGGLAQGRKPHGGSKRPYCRPPLTILIGDGPRSLG